MEFSTASYTTQKEILKYDHYVAKPVALDFTSVEANADGIKMVKAGTPIKSADGGWVASNDGNATAILLYDVRDDRPIGAGVIHGFIDKAKAEAASGLTLSGSISIPNVVIE